MTVRYNCKDTLCSKFLNSILPNRIKRLLFISSFIAHIKKIHKPTTDLTEKINTLFNLSNDSRSISFPMRIEKHIWANIQIDELFSTRNITTVSEIIKHKPQTRIISEEIVKRMPNWLRYGSNTTIKSDLVSVLNNIDKLVQN